MNTELLQVAPKPLGFPEIVCPRRQVAVITVEHFEHSALITKEIEDNSADRSLNLCSWQPQTIRILLLAYQPIGDVVAVTASLLDRVAGRQPVTRMIEEDTG